MAFLGQTFQVKEIASENNFELLPAGWYTAKVTAAEIKTTKAGNGTYLAVRYDITGPSYQGRVVFGNINLTNPNQKAEQIGLQQLGNIARAVGLEVISDSDQLIGHDLQIKLSIKKDDKYDDSNEIKGFKAIDGVTAAEEPKIGGKTATPPWGKK